MQVQPECAQPTAAKRGNNKRLVVLSVLLAVVILLLLITILLVVHAIVQASSVGPSAAALFSRLPARSASGSYAKAAVVAGTGLCSEIGRNLLLLGGNAVDAAVGTTMCEGIASPHSSGLGGGLFMTIYNASTNECVVIDGRETAPAAASERMFEGRPANASISSYLAVGVPGYVHALYTAHTLFGSRVLSWQQTVQPTVELLRDGVPVDDELARTLAKSKNLKNDVRAAFVNPSTGRLYVEGELMRSRQLYEFVAGLANATDPVQYFYDRPSMLTELQANGGLITPADLSSYASRVHRGEAVLYSRLGGATTVCGPPPPSGAAFTMAILNVMTGFDNAVPDTRYFHRLIEAMKFAFAYRSESGDADFVPAALQMSHNITGREFGDRVRRLITDVPQALSAYGGGYAQLNDSGTSHIGAIDASGNAVSLTASINTAFGSGWRAPEGFLWNNEMDDFSQAGAANYFGLPPSPTNFVAPGKRMQSSMSPLVAFDATRSQARFVIGAAGGSRIISSSAQVALGVLELSQTVRQAVDAPRLHNQLVPEQTMYEQLFPVELVDELAEKGHELQAYESTKSVVMALFKDPATERIHAATDYRKGTGTHPAGY